MLKDVVQQITMSAELELEDSPVVDATLRQLAERLGYQNILAMIDELDVHIRVCHLEDERIKRYLVVNDKHVGEFLMCFRNGNYCIEYEE